jgi:hypothetical protein
MRSFSSDMIIIEKQDITANVDKEADRKNIQERIEDEYTILVYPNPTNNFATFEYNLPVSGIVNLYVINAFGQLVKDLVVNENQDKGIYKVSFNASNLSPGTYLYTLQVGDFKETKKLILIK